MAGMPDTSPIPVGSREYRKICCAARSTELFDRKVVLRRVRQCGPLATSCLGVQLLFSALLFKGVSLVTFLHQQESNPLAAGQRTLSLFEPCKNRNTKSARRWRLRSEYKSFRCPAAKG
jgi:hypothetical protein